MEIITRPEARKQSLKTYFTGLACRNGHLTYRYTQSGTCAGCVRQANGSVDDPTLAARKSAKAQLLQARFRVFDVDRESFALAAWGMAVMRFPELEVRDIDPLLLGTHKAAGTAMYAFNCHSGDVEALQQVANAMVNAHSVSGAQVRAQALAASLVYLPEDTTPPMNFK